MAKQIIVLQTGSPWLGQLSITYALWATVPSNLQVMYAQGTGFTSAYVNATTAEIASLRSGATVEKVESTNVPVGTGVATIKNILQSAFTTYQNSITNDNRFQFFGTFYDGTTWTNGGL